MEKWLVNNAEYTYLDECAKLNKIVAGYKNIDENP